MRWDFIVFATCEGVEELSEAIRGIRGVLGCT